MEIDTDQGYKTPSINKTDFILLKDQKIIQKTIIKKKPSHGNLVYDILETSNMKSNIKIQNMKQYITPLLRVGALALLLLTIYEQNNVITEYKATKSKFVADTLKIAQLETQVDSLQSELFVQKTIVGRYELGLDYLKERNLKDYLVVKYFIQSQTE